jgi:hypothetical protein
LEEGGGRDLDSDEAETRSKRTKEQVQAKNRNKNNTFQSDTPAGRRISSKFCVFPRNAKLPLCKAWYLPADTYRYLP